MNEFLTSNSLYEPFLILSDYSNGNKKFFTEEHFKKQTFDYFCETEQKVTTFELNLEYNINFNSLVISDNYFKQGYLNYVFRAICTCQSCKSEKVDFLLNVFSDKKVSQKLTPLTPAEYKSGIRADEPDTRIYIRKVGISPEFKINLKKDVVKFFDREANTFYFKGVKCLKENFGVGALAYFRRIIEKELKHIIEITKELPDSDKEQIQKLIEEHEKNPSVTTIYDNIFQYLPKSLQGLGENPIKLLYNQTSQGLHSLSEEDSLDKAKGVLSLLEFVITKINEERSTIKNIKDIIKDLRKD